MPSHTGAPLPRSSPSEQGVDAAAVMALLDTLEARPDVEMHSLMLVRHGHVVAEGWWSPYSPDRPHLLYSLSKSFTSAAVGIAQEEGLLRLDDTVLTHFPELDDEVRDARSRSLTLRHLAAMASGHTRDTIDEVLALDRENPVRGFLLTPPDREPGSVFAYNQPCTYTLAAVVQRRSGMPLVDYLRPRLLDPLGIGDVGWASWPPGQALGFTGLHARTEDVAKLGQLHLRCGRWGDRQLLPESWVREATATQVDNPTEPSPDWRQGYGYQFWMARHGYRGDGAYGQFCVVLPEHDTVLATTACTEQMQAVLDAVWTHLLPGLGRTGDPSLQDQLSARLSTLHIPPPDSSAGDEPEWTSWAGAFQVVPETTGARSPMLTEVELHRDGELHVTLREPANAVTLPVGVDGWRISEPTDATGGTVPVAAACHWPDHSTVRVEVRFLETPHRLDVALSRADRTAVARWPAAPLGSARIADLHSP